MELLQPEIETNEYSSSEKLLDKFATRVVLEYSSPRGSPSSHDSLRLPVGLQTLVRRRRAGQRLEVRLLVYAIRICVFAAVPILGELVVDWTGIYEARMMRLRPGLPRWWRWLVIISTVQYSNNVYSPHRSRGDFYSVVLLFYRFCCICIHVQHCTAFKASFILLFELSNFVRPFVFRLSFSRLLFSFPSLESSQALGENLSNGISRDAETTVWCFIRNHDPSVSLLTVQFAMLSCIGELYIFAHMHGHWKCS